MTGAVIDRFEGGKAVLLLGEAEETAILPRWCLPPDIGEGDYLQLEIIFDAAATQAARDEAAALLAGLDQKK